MLTRVGLIMSILYTRIEVSENSVIILKTQIFDDCLINEYLNGRLYSC